MSVINPDVKVDDPPPLHGDPPPPVGRPLPQPVDGTDVPGTKPVIEPIKRGEGPRKVVAVTPPKGDHEDADDQAVRFSLGTEELIDTLMATGAEVKVSGEVLKQPFFSASSRVVEVNGERVEVIDYGDAAALEYEADRIPPDGSSVGTTMIMWVGPLHFFWTESVIVLYVGENPTVLDALAKVMGPQFAGR